MKKLILASVSLVALASSFNANAATATICSSPTVAGTGAAVAVSATGFVKVAFTPKCSANVNMVGDDMGTFYRVGSNSGKGKNTFNGSTMGGGVAPYSSCASSTGCTSTEAQAAATNAASS